MFSYLLVRLLLFFFALFAMIQVNYCWSFILRLTSFRTLLRFGSRQTVQQNTKLGRSVRKTFTYCQLSCFFTQNFHNCVCICLSKQLFIASFPATLLGAESLVVLIHLGHESSERWIRRVYHQPDEFPFVFSCYLKRFKVLFIYTQDRKSVSLQRGLL